MQERRGYEIAGRRLIRLSTCNVSVSRLSLPKAKIWRRKCLRSIRWLPDWVCKWNSNPKRLNDITRGIVCGASQKIDAESHPLQTRDWIIEASSLIHQVLKLIQRCVHVTETYASTLRKWTRVRFHFKVRPSYSFPFKVGGLICLRIWLCDSN